jgi:hypothetical protein
MPSVSDDEGWFAGTMFGDRADISVRDELTPRSA